MSVYPSKVDLWLAVVLIVSPLSIVGTGIFTLSVNRPAALMAIAAGVFSGILTIILVFPCEYTITNSELLIKSGILHYKVRLQDIARVEASSNPRSAPALSLTRVQITLKQGGMYLVSPTDRDRFMQELETKIDAIGLSNSR